MTTKDQEEHKYKAILVWGCSTCPNRITSTAFGGGKLYPSGIHVSRCTITGSDITYTQGQAPDDCPLPYATTPEAGTTKETISNQKGNQ